MEPELPNFPSPFAALLAVSADRVYVFGEDGRCTQGSAAAAAAHGLSVAQMIGQSVRELGISSLYDGFARDFSQVIATRLSARAEISDTIDGQPRNCELLFSAVSDPQGLPGVMLLIRRIAEEKTMSPGLAGGDTVRNEAALLAVELESQRRKLIDLMEAVPGVVWEAWGTPDGARQQINFVSGYVEKMLGYSTEEWLSTPNFWLSIVHPHDRMGAAERATQTFLGLSDGSNQFRWVRKDGEILHVEAHSSVIFDSEGKPAGMRGVTIDISSRRAAEAERDRLAAVTEKSSDFIAIADREGRSIFLNEKGRELVGLSLEQDLSSLTLIDFFAPADRSFVIDHALETALSQGRFEGQLDFRHFQTGESIPVLFNVFPIRDRSNNELLGLATVTRDLRERKRTEAEREALLVREQGAREMAESANRIKDDFLATLSHELRTPLTAILGWSRLLADPGIDKQSFDMGLDTIQRSAVAQAQLIDDVLDVSRITSGKLSLQIAPVSLASVLDAAINSVRPSASARGVALIVDLPAEPGTIRGDASRLQQVFWNLLTNAVKFTPGGGSVHVRLEHGGSMERVVVTDTGRGIEQSFLPHVFEPFRQAESSITRSHGGLGLGLSIVRYLVESHGGTVQARSGGLNAGATFTVELPVREAGEQLASGATGRDAVMEKNPYPDLTGVRVLFVDDQEDTRVLVRSVVEHCGGEVMLAASAPEGLRMFLRQRPDILVSDIAMPGEDGYSLMMRIRATETTPRVPALALTAFSRPEDQAHIRTAGFDGHLPKPVEPYDLARQIHLLTRG